jgi:hypothetical protein
MGSSKASRALRERARTRIAEARTRSKRVLDAWRAATERQIAALDDVAGALADEESTPRDLAHDLCAQWVGTWADAMELLHETCRACVHPSSSGKTPPENTITRDGVVLPLITFAIEHFVEAADPVVVPGVTRADAPNIRNVGLGGGGGVTAVAAAIPAANVRVSTYGSTVLVSLVELGPLKLAAGVYQGDLTIGSQIVAVVQVTVT